MPSMPSIRQGLNLVFTATAALLSPGAAHANPELAARKALQQDLPETAKARMDHRESIIHGTQDAAKAAGGRKLQSYYASYYSPAPAPAPDSSCPTATDCDTLVKLGSNAWAPKIIDDLHHKDGFTQVQADASVCNGGEAFDREATTYTWAACLDEDSQLKLFRATDQYWTIGNNAEIAADAFCISDSAYTDMINAPGFGPSNFCGYINAQLDPSATTPGTTSYSTTSTTTPTTSTSTTTPTTSTTTTSTTSTSSSTAAATTTTTSTRTTSTSSTTTTSSTTSTSTTSSTAAPTTPAPITLTEDMMTNWVQNADTGFIMLEFLDQISDRFDFTEVDTEILRFGEPTFDTSAPEAYVSYPFFDPTAGLFNNTDFQDAVVATYDNISDEDYEAALDSPLFTAETWPEAFLNPYATTTSTTTSPAQSTSTTRRQTTSSSSLALTTLGTTRGHGNLRATTALAISPSTAQAITNPNNTVKTTAAENTDSTAAPIYLPVNVTESYHPELGMIAPEFVNDIFINGGTFANGANVDLYTIGEDGKFQPKPEFFDANADLISDLFSPGFADFIDDCKDNPYWPTSYLPIIISGDANWAPTTTSPGNSTLALNNTDANNNTGVTTLAPASSTTPSGEALASIWNPGTISGTTVGAAAGTVAVVVGIVIVAVACKWRRATLKGEVTDRQESSTYNDTLASQSVEMSQLRTRATTAGRLSDSPAASPGGVSVEGLSSIMVEGSDDEGKLSEPSSARKERGSALKFRLATTSSRSELYQSTKASPYKYSGRTDLEAGRAKARQRSFETDSTVFAAMGVQSAERTRVKDLFRYGLASIRFTPNPSTRNELRVANSIAYDNNSGTYEIKKGPNVVARVTPHPSLTAEGRTSVYVRLTQLQTLPPAKIVDLLLKNKKHASDYATRYSQTSTIQAAFREGRFTLEMHSDDGVNYDELSDIARVDNDVAASSIIFKDQAGDEIARITTEDSTTAKQLFADHLLPLSQRRKGRYQLISLLKHFNLEKDLRTDLFGAGGESKTAHPQSAAAMRTGDDIPRTHSSDDDDDDDDDAAAQAAREAEQLARRNEAYADDDDEAKVQPAEEKKEE